MDEHIVDQGSAAESSPRVPSQDVARPLHVLVPLITADLEQGRDAATRASLPHYRAAGEKLLEAKSQLPHGAFQPWVRREFKVSPRTAQHYMRLAEATAEKRNAFRFSSLNDSIRQQRRPRIDRESPPEPLDDSYSNAHLHARSFELHRQKQELALRIVNKGYKALAVDLHPDTGSSDDTRMKQLNMARDWLRELVKHQ
jgi:hypothetical protein